MEAEQKRDPRERLVDSYFHHIRELRSGVPGAVERLVEMWHPEGTFEFAGAPPVTGTYTGINAIHVLYKNRFLANGMRVAPPSPAAKRSKRHLADSALGVVSTDVQRIRPMEDKVVVGWKTLVSTTGQQGFEVSGSHTFVFEGDKIRSLRVVLTPKPAEVSFLSLDEMTVDDIGQLSLAAWMVV